MIFYIDFSIYICRVNKFIMKHILLLTAWLWMSYAWATEPTPKPIPSHKAKHKHHTKKETTNGNKMLTPASQGSFTPKGSVNKQGVPENHYHNEQDNFKKQENGNKPAPTPTGKPNEHSNIIIPGEDTHVANKTDATPAISFKFSAENCPNNDPPDNTMAIAANGNIVSAVNCGIFFYNSSGTQTGSNTYPTFFNTTGSEFSDPRVVYDPYNDRFIFFIQFGHTPATSVLYIAFSSSNDPTASWHYYYYPVSSFAANDWFDYPSIGINQTDVCIGGNLFDASNNGDGNLVLMFKKADGYAQATNLGGNYWTNLTTGSGSKGFTIVPATTAQNTSYSGKFYMVSTASGGSSAVTLYTITGTAGNNPTVASTDITTPQAYSPSSTATQPNGINLANYKAGCRVQSACYLNGVIHLVYAANYNSGGTDYNSIYYSRINTSNNTIRQNWSFLSGSNYNYPAVASFGTNTADQTAIIGFLKSDASTNPEVRFKYFDNNMNQLGSVQVHQGDGAVNYTWATEQRWGDYIGIQRRYSASQPEVWMGGSYGNSSNIWQTEIAQITGYPGLVSISEVLLDNTPITIYPNPVKDQLYIKSDFKDFYGFPELYDIQGRQVQLDVTRRDNEMFQLDVSRLSVGTYLVKMGTTKSLRFVKE